MTRSASIGVGILALVILATGAAATESDLYDKALAMYRAGRYPEAIAILREKRTPDGGDLALLGWALLKSGNARDAKARFGESIARNPRSADPHCGSGYAALRMGRLAEALGSFDRGLALDGANGDCRAGKALVLERTGRGGTPSGEPRSAAAAGKAPAADKRASVFAQGRYFWIGTPSDPPRPLYVNGVNLGFGLPGKYPTEFPEGERTYLEWLGNIRTMNANVVRVYTILPPAFYRALKTFNRGKGLLEKIYLVQGIWTEPPEGGDFRDPAFLKKVTGEIADAVDVVHGNATIAARRGHAHGTYRDDVSDSLLGFIFGREWEPPEVIAYNRRRTAETKYEGRYLSISGANPMEVWLTRMLDALVSRQQDRYGVARPVAWMNWPPLDPIPHESESTLREEFEIRKKIGETPPRVDFDNSYDDDAVTLDETKVRVDPRFRGGIFASYHVYPYYPDFMVNDRRYGEGASTGMAGRYFRYLRELKDRYREMPLLVSEFGVPTSRGVARYHPEALGHGGHDEESQARAVVAMARAIREAECAGGIVFSYVDEWHKASWMARGAEDRDPFWYNAEDPEESFGLMAAAPAGSAGKIAGDPGAWAGASAVYTSRSSSSLKVVGDGADGARRLRRLTADADAGYLYLRLDVDGPVDWARTAYLIAIDTFGTGEGDHALPFGTGLESAVGFEYVVLLHGENSRILVDAPYSRTAYDAGRRRIRGLSGYRAREEFGTVPNRAGRFSEIVTVQRRRFSRDGTVFPEKVYNASRLRQGSAAKDSLADFHYGEKDRMLELRIPWALLNVSDPSRRRVVLSAGRRATTEGFRFLAVSYKPRGSGDSEAADIGPGADVTDLLPRSPSEITYYRWNGWDVPAYALRPKKSYFALKELFAAGYAPDAKIHVPPGFDFSTVVKLHYDNAVDRFPAQRGSGGESLYGRGLANLVDGLVKNDPLSVAKAQSLFAAARDAAGAPREREVAELARVHAGNVLSGQFRKSPGDKAQVSPTTIRRDPPPSRIFRKVTIGRSSIRVGRKSKIRTQVDRVTRDWLSAVNGEAAPWALADNALVPWHEGEKIRELRKLTGATTVPVWGTKVKKIGNAWYAPDAEGRWRFNVSDDKILNYPTTLLLDDRTAIVNDTHGVSALAWDAEDADLVVGCGDSDGKIAAAHYLAGRGVDVYMPTDRFLPALIGTRTPGTIVGSAPVKRGRDGAVIGDQPVAFDIRETIVVSDFDGVSYPLHYYDTPHRYFRELAIYLGVPLKIVPVVVRKEDGAGVVVEEARKRGAGIIGIRVRGKREHDAVAEWLSEDQGRRAVLFHTAVYPEGYRLFFEFPRQTSFGDIRIEVE